MTRRFKTNALNSFICYMKLTHGFSVGKDIDEKELEKYKDLTAGVEALIWVGKYSFWDWDDGSSILFWRWTMDIRHGCEDGCELFVKGKLPLFTNKQCMPVEKL